MKQEKKQKQLGMNPSTASARLVKDVLYKLVVQTGQNDCFVCGKPVSRDTFSIEHKVAWLDSIDPVKLFFDTDNISFSHLSCNVGAGRRPHKRQDRETYEAEKLKANADRRRRIYSPEQRRRRYETTGH